MALQGLLSMGGAVGAALKPAEAKALCSPPQGNSTASCLSLGKPGSFLLEVGPDLGLDVG